MIYKNLNVNYLDKILATTVMGSRAIQSADGSVRVKRGDHFEVSITINVMTIGAFEFFCFQDVGMGFLSSLLAFLVYLGVGLTWPVSLFYCFKVGGWGCTFKNCILILKTFNSISFVSF